MGQSPRVQRTSRGRPPTTYDALRRLLHCGISLPLMSANGMVRPCSGPASERRWEGAPKTRSTPCHPSSIAEAVQRPTMKFVAAKTVEQLDSLSV